MKPTLQEIFTTVFNPDPMDLFSVMVDVPTATVADTPDWKDRRELAAEWVEELATTGFHTLPLIDFDATGGNNADLPALVRMNGETAALKDALAPATVIIALTQYSATAPLHGMLNYRNDLRVASMPRFARRMMDSAMCADYRDVSRKAHMLADCLTRARQAHVVFSAENASLTFDLRHRTGFADGGLCHPSMAPTLINLPSGEGFIAPYEGERAGDSSQTEGLIPVFCTKHKETVWFTVKQNRISCVDGPARSARHFNDLFEVDAARRNIAELGLGCNDAAVVWGNVLEDEKAGFHWAFGRSEHIGGITGPECFTDPRHVIHSDVVYARQCPIHIKSMDIITDSGVTDSVIRDGVYTVF